MLPGARGLRHCCRGHTTSLPGAGALRGIAAGGIRHRCRGLGRCAASLPGAYGIAAVGWGAAASLPGGEGRGGRHRCRGAEMRRLGVDSPTWSQVRRLEVERAVMDAIIFNSAVAAVDLDGAIIDAARFAADRVGASRGRARVVG